MKLKIKLVHETRIIEHVQQVTVMPDEGHEDRVLNEDYQKTDGGFIVVLTEEEERHG
jgi:hypothetical protein